MTRTAKRARIRPGACVMQDMSFWPWPVGCLDPADVDIVFECEPDPVGGSQGWSCTAKRYGELGPGGNYGGGAVFVDRAKDLRPIKTCPTCGSERA